MHDKIYWFVTQGHVHGARIKSNPMALLYRYLHDSFQTEQQSKIHFRFVFLFYLFFILHSILYIFSIFYQLFHLKMMPKLWLCSLMVVAIVAIHAHAAEEGDLAVAESAIGGKVAGAAVVFKGDSNTLVF